MDIKKLSNDIINGKRLTREDDLSFFKTVDLDELCSGADEIREKLCGNHIDLCSIINGRSGGCSENCKFCAQSAHHHTSVDRYKKLLRTVNITTTKAYIDILLLQQVGLSRVKIW